MFRKLKYRYLFVFCALGLIIFLLSFQGRNISKKVINIKKEQSQPEIIIADKTDGFLINNNTNLNTDKDIIKKKAYREFCLEGLKEYMHFVINRDISDSKFIALFRGIIENDFSIVSHHIQLLDLTELKESEIKILINLIGSFTTDLRIFDLLFQSLDFSLFSDTRKDISDYAFEHRNFILLNSLINKYGWDINNAANKHSLKMQSVGNKDLEDWISQYDAQFNQYDYDNCRRSIFSKGGKLETLKKYLDAGFEVSDDRLADLMVYGRSKTSEEAIEFYEFIFSLAQDPSSLYQNTNLIADRIIHKKTDVETIKYLVDKGYSLDGKNEHSQNALDVATYYKNSEIIIYLLNNGFSADQKIKIRDYYDFDTKRMVFKQYENLYIAAEALNLKDVLCYLKNDMELREHNTVLNNMQ